MTQSFVNGVGLPRQAFFNGSPAWLVGSDLMAAAPCDRAKQGQVFGLQTMVSIPSANGVVKLGSTDPIYQSSDLMNKVRVLFNFSGSSGGIESSWAPPPPTPWNPDQGENDPSSLWITDPEMKDGSHLESDVGAGNKRNHNAFQSEVLIEHGRYTMAFNGIRDLDSEKQLWSGHCRVSRAWLGVNVTTDKVLHFDLILMDSKGNDIWVHIPPVLQEHFKRLLQEQQMASKLNDVDVLSDVVGQVVQHSDAIKTTNLARKTIRKELQLKLIEGDVVKFVIWGRVIAEFDKLIKPGDDEQVILVVTAVSVKPFQGELCFNSSGSTVLYPNLDIPEVKAFTTSNVQPQQPVFVELPPPPSIPNVTLSELLELQLDPDNEECVYAVECKVVGIKPFWCYMGCPTCVLKPMERHGEYYCVKCNKPTPTRAAKYRIQLDVESNSGPATFIIFFFLVETFIIFEYEAKRFFGVSGDELFNKTGQNSEVPPADLLKMVGVTKLFHVKFKINLYSDSQADFTVLKILEPTAQSPASVLHKDASCSSITSGVESSQTSSQHSIPIPAHQEADKGVFVDITPDNKLKRKMHPE
ncbi:unnamed protein product [Linum trigynum]|uniref:Replication factor A C-terminal domain-containing protein n=1 Tax=Linum trigynum TaxID=586398 RepID=A0AAV2DZT5_9ROSI